MLVVTRHVVRPEESRAFLASARDALEVLGEQAGFRSGRIGRATDDASLWSIATEWESVGAYRRALSSFDVKVRAVPLLSTARDEPTAYDVVEVRGSGGPVLDGTGSLAADAGTVSLGEAAAPQVPTDLG